MKKTIQHYLPQGYLRRFTIKNEKSLVWEYDKTNGVVSKTPKSVRKICTRPNYYATPSESSDCLDNTTLENEIAKSVEDPAIKIIDKIPNDEKMFFDLSGIDRECLAFFVAFTFSRNPAVRDGIRELHKNVAEQTMEYELHELLKNAHESVAGLINEKGIQNTLAIEVPDWVSIEHMIDIARYGAGVLLKKSWMFVSPAESQNFVTCDNPYVFTPPAEFENIPNIPIGPFHPLSLVRFPLRKDLALIATENGHDGGNYYYSHKIDNDFVSKINFEIIRNSIRYVYSSTNSDLILKDVKELKGSGGQLRVY